jgi:hypothetical protein
MLAFGCVLAAVGVVLAGLLALLFRNSRAPGWTRPEAVVFLSTVPVAGMIGVGAGYALYGLNAVLRGDGDVRELAALVVVPALVALIWHALGIKGRLRTYGEAGGEPAGGFAAMPLVGSTTEPPDVPAPGGPQRPPTRTAA